MRLMKTALFVFGLASVFFFTGNSFAQNGMHQHGKTMMGTQKQDSTAMKPGNQMMQSGSMRHQGHMMMNMQSQDSTAVMPGNTMMQPNQTLCPVMGGKIDKKFFADYEGQRIYFCCPSCLATFQKDPDKYMKSMKEKGVQLEKVPSKEQTKTNSSNHRH